MIADYTSLQSAIADYLGRSDLSAQIQTFIAQAEARIYRQLRTIDMEAAFSGTCAAGIATAVPANYLAIKELYVSTSSGFQPLERVDLWWLRENYPTQSAQSTPVYFAREGQNLIFAPAPDQTYTLGGVYYQRGASLSATNTTNWLTSKNPDLIMTAALLEACTYLGDTAGLQYWTQRFQDTVQAVQTADKDERFSGSPLMMRAG